MRVIWGDVSAVGVQATSPTLMMDTGSSKITWRGGDSDNEGNAEISNGFVIFNDVDASGANRQDILMALKLGDDFTFCADDTEYSGKVTKAPTKYKDLTFFKTSAGYPEKSKFGTLSISGAATVALLANSAAKARRPHTTRCAGYTKRGRTMQFF